jgi:hypothetical protein
MKWIDKLISLPTARKLQFVILAAIAYDALLFEDLWMFALIVLLGYLLWSCYDAMNCNNSNYCLVSCTNDQQSDFNRKAKE